eukprot:gnl/MRDRNA2_/MRDRNA2_30273_c0_seq1.p1 gnl/MRDRNA2_/MRDRNA2_30273_c0~~gnl/MRDRNA2_/MRDRNA2_30273_c0_seq1.p1  ORF type:complete len:433 (+),score=115.73 gnl/MRDRNA2_/MRDRNA2_30273_c0_seq1:64-1299(+)
MPGEPLVLAKLKAGATEDEIMKMIDKDGDGRVDTFVFDVNARDPEMWSCLHWAAHDGKEFLTQKLLEFHAIPNCSDNNGATPLMMAAFNGHNGCVEALCKERVINVLQGNNFKATAIHYAARQGKADVIQTLVNHSAQVDHIDRHGDTPLIWAAKEGQLIACEKLVELKADIQMDNFAGEDPIEHAEEAGHEHVVKYLEKAAGIEAITSAKMLGEFFVFHYGSVEEGWKQRLDHSGDGKISWTEFFYAARSIGLEFGGPPLIKDPTAVWEELDDDKSGEISMQELLDETAGIRKTKQASGIEVIDSAKLLGQWLKFTHGSLEAAWNERMDLDGGGTISWAEFQHACKGIGIVESPETIWRELDDDYSGFISLQELEDELNGIKHTDPEKAKDVKKKKKGLIRERRNRRFMK